MSAPMIGYAEIEMKKNRNIGPIFLTLLSRVAWRMRNSIAQTPVNFESRARPAIKPDNINQRLEF
jgi:hypothetical protein